MASQIFPIENLEFIPAQHYYWRAGRLCNMIVPHETESAAGTARNVAEWFGSSRFAPAASAHVVIGTDGAFGCVMPQHASWNAGPSNECTYAIEICGYAHWNAAQWEMAALDRAKQHIKAACAYFSISPKILSDDEVAICLHDSLIHRGVETGAVSGLTGIATHVQLNRVWKNHSKYGLPIPHGDLTHLCPGVSFPLEKVIPDAPADA